VRILNKSTDCIPDDAVYIGRPSKWGNPFILGIDGTRSTVISMYREYLQNSVLLGDLNELVGHDLVCWCKPLACHGDVLCALVEELRRERIIER
jgi:hypothetical protein